MTPQSALVILAPEAEPLVADHRKRYDPSAAAGMPAHVTILYPFVPPEAVDRAVEETVAGIVAGVACFDAVFGAVGSFADVLFLAPNRDEPFRVLTELVWSSFPQHPPYAGQHKAIVPHLTVGHFSDPVALEAASRQISPALVAEPLHVSVTEVALMDNAKGMWERRRAFPLSRRPLTSM